MATRKPLAELRAAFKNARVGAQQNSLSAEFFFGEKEDWASLFGFIASEWKEQMFVLQIRPLDETYKPAKCDPNQPLPPENEVDDELARLRRQHAELLAAMTDRDAEPPAQAPAG